MPRFRLVRAMNRVVLCIVCVAVFMRGHVQAQDTPLIPLGLSDPYIMFIPVGWATEDDSPFGFMTTSNDDVVMQLLDPVRLSQYIPYDANATPRQLLIDYWRYIHADTLTRSSIELLTADDTLAALYTDPQNPQFATYIIAFADQHFALVEVRANDGIYDDEREIVHRMLGTLSLSLDGEQRADVIYDDVVLPSGAYRVNLPIDWLVEPSLAQGQVFMVGDGIQTLMFPPDALSASFEFPPNVELAVLAQVIESTFFDVDLSNIELTESRMGDVTVLGYGFRSISNQTDTQVLLIQYADDSVAYFRTSTLADVLTPALRGQIRQVASSIRPVTDADSERVADANTSIMPNGGDWRVMPRAMMRQICDGDLAERLIPVTDNIRQLFSDFDTIAVNPDGTLMTIANDAVINLFQRGTLQRDGMTDFQMMGDGIVYRMRPHREDLMVGQLSILAPNDAGEMCRFTVNVDLRYIE